MPDNRFSILYVEDEPDDVFFMQKALTRAGVVTTLNVAEDGDRAVAYLSGSAPFQDRSRHPVPTLILLDVNLPVRSGFEVLAWVRKHNELAGLPVVMFSSSGRAEDRARAQALGADEYILKPTSGVSFFEVAEHLKKRWLCPDSQSAGSSATTA